MTPRQADIARALHRCTFQPGIGAKRFAREMAQASRLRETPELTERQAAWLESLAWTYRRQMPAPLVPLEKPAKW